MAVSFKVPASPKRNISASDTFIGVDLTNTAVDMEGTRSPNAENMVRHVPGKVRKRMGYYKEILFGKKTNVNFLDGTSASPIEILLNNPGNAFILYNTIRPLNNEGATLVLYVEFDYKSEDDFYIYTRSNIVPASEDWTHYSAEITPAVSEIDKIWIASDVIQNVSIKNCAMMLEKDANYVWSPAPKYFVERETNDPVYGVHFLRRLGDSYEGDRVTNVNRALATSDTYESFSLTSTKTKIYDLVDELRVGVEVTIDFDFEITDYDYHDAYVYLFGSDTSFEHTRGADGHFTITTTVSDFNILHPEVDLSAENGRTLTILVKNFTATYNKDQKYKWSPAPEDDGGTFNVDDLTIVGTKNYATNTSGTATGYNFGIDWAVADFNFYSSQEDERIEGFTHVKFDVTTSNTGTVSIDNLVLYFGKFTKDTPYYTSYGNITTTLHVEAFVRDCSSVSARWNLESIPTGTPQFKLNVSNVVLNKYDVRKAFNYSPKSYLYHVGKDFYLRDANTDIFDKAFSDANEHISRSFQLNNKCYIIDGKGIYQYNVDGGSSVESIGQDNAYIPTVTIGKEPSGGGTAYEALNLIQPGFYELFQGKENKTQFQLSFSGLDATACRAWLLNSNAEWVAKYENADFTVNRTTGKITFSTAPGESPITGEDNVKILAYRTVPDYRDRIVKCTTGILFGVAGAGDRLFVTGNPDHPNWDFYSQQYDPTYFPDLGYSVLGSEQSQIMGYAIVNNYLTTFKDGFDMSQSVFVREGDLLKTGEEEKETSEPVFKLINTLQGEGVLAPYTFGYLQTEPLFLTKAGVFAITEQDITGEKYTQNRSFYLDGTLRKEPNLEDAIATVYDNQYILAVNNQLFVLDGLQATRTDKSEPYATRQYAGFYCTNVPATYIWSDDALCFGTADGRVCRFYTDDKSPDSYNDDGKAIYACWETPDLDGQLFYKNKTFRYFAVRLMKAVKTSVKMLSEKSGIWTLIKEDVAIGNAPDFENWDFETFSFSCDESEKLLHSKVRVKKVDKARFRVENDKVNEPFGLSDLALEYIESGNYKG